jgi:two-component system OmpR family sensor kinase
VLLLASVVIGVVTGVFLRSFLVKRLDQQLVQAGGRYSASLEHTPDENDHDADNAVPGQSAGTLGVRLVRGRVSQAAVVNAKGENAPVRLSAGDLTALNRARVGGPARSVDLSSIGDYRIRADRGRDGDVQLTGLPLHPVHETLARLAAVELGVFAGVLVVGGLIGTVLIRRTMRPLARLTTTAREVSELPLTAADTEIPRPIAPTHPASEIEHLDAAFTHMLDNVHEALT